MPFRIITNRRYFEDESEKDSDSSDDTLLLTSGPSEVPHPPVSDDDLPLKRRHPFNTTTDNGENSGAECNMPQHRQQDKGDGKGLHNISVFSIFLI